MCQKIVFILLQVQQPLGLQMGESSKGTGGSKINAFFPLCTYQDIKFLLNPFPHKLKTTLKGVIHFLNYNLIVIGKDVKI